MDKLIMALKQYRLYHSNDTTLLSVVTGIAFHVVGDT